MSYVGKITDTSGNTGLVGSTLYGTCSTGASTAAKEVTCADFDQLLLGVTIHVKFTNRNTASTPTLNVNGTGAKNIYKYGNTTPGTTAATSWYAGSVVSFTYDGSGWQMNDHIDDTNTQTVSSVAGKTGAVTLTKSDVGLGNVGNFKAVSTVASQGLTSTEQSNARANIGAGTSNLTIGTTSSTAMAGNTNINNVTQTEVTTDANFRILFSNSANNTTETAGVGKESGLIYNPSTGSFGHGYLPTISGLYAHAEGANTDATGSASHAEGNSTIAKHACQHVFGAYNIEDPSTSATTKKGNYIEIVGNGIGATSSERSNARTLDWDGNEWLAGSLTAACDAEFSSSVTDAAVSNRVNTITLQKGQGATTSTGSDATPPEITIKDTYTISSTDMEQSLSINTTDIILGGNRGNTWDGTHTSLKAAFTPEVVRSSTVNLNNYTSSGKYILTGNITTKTNFPLSQPGYLEVTTWSENATNYFCRQDFKLYNTGVWMDETYSRIGTSTNGGSSWTWNRWYSQTHFLPGESYTIQSGTITSGYVTSSSTALVVSVWLPKSMEHTNGLSSKPSTVNLTVRGANGQYLQNSGSGYAFKWYDNFRIQPINMQIEFRKSDSSAFSNCVNNDPYAIYFVGGATITFN